MSGGSTILAAGAVLWRPTTGGGVEVGIVHRPRYDDWSLPKGKLECGETMLAAAAREVTEETGQQVSLGAQLGNAHYEVAAGPKEVRYWSARAHGGTFVPGNEVDQLRWLSPAAALRTIDYGHERAVLERFAALGPTRTVLVVRHAKAGKRSEWSGDDNLRPLNAGGWRQEATIRSVVPLFGAQQAYAAPRTRCVQTIERTAEQLGLRVHPEPLLSEEGYWPEPEAGFARLSDIVAGIEVCAVVCSQGGVIPDLVESLATAADLQLDGVRSRKGSIWALSFSTQAIPQLRAADYYPDLGSVS